MITVGGLFFTSSLGAWLALSVGLGCWFLWLISGQLSNNLPFSQKIIFGGLLFVLMFISLFMVRFVLSSGLAQEDSATRLGLIQQTLFLIEDFALTGSGLATFPALYAQYVQVTPSFFAAYSNLYFDIWLEQGFFAMLALLVLLGVSFLLLLKGTLAKPEGKIQPLIGVDENGIEVRRRRKRKRKKLAPNEMGLFKWAAFSSLIVMLLHGLIDDALYGAQASPLLFFAPAMVILVTRQRKAAEVVAGRWRRWGIGVGATAVLLIGIFFGFRQTVQSHWHANLGALAMARAELVNWPTNQWDAGDDLARFDEATAQLEQAIAIDPENRTANHRLGLIAMVKRDYETAVTHLAQADAVSQDYRGIVKSLGYSHVWQGDFDQAIDYLSQIPESRAEMNIYSDWWERQNRSDLATKASEMAAILENITLMSP
jgi:tetratricopeptide (TPR) repeat protein